MSWEQRGKMISWILYLFLFYSLTIAYMAGGGGFVASIFHGASPEGLDTPVHGLSLPPGVPWSKGR
jgi:amino acid permease